MFLPRSNKTAPSMATACACTGIGRRGMLFAARVLGATGMRLMTDKKALKAVQAEFKRNAKGYQPLL